MTSAKAAAITVATVKPRTWWLVRLSKAVLLIVITCDLVRPSAIPSHTKPNPSVMTNDDTRCCATKRPEIAPAATATAIPTTTATNAPAWRSVIMSVAAAEASPSEYGNARSNSATASTAVRPTPSSTGTAASSRIDLKLATVPNVDGLSIQKNAIISANPMSVAHFSPRSIRTLRVLRSGRAAAGSAAPAASGKATCGSCALGSAAARAANPASSGMTYSPRLPAFAVTLRSSPALAGELRLPLRQEGSKRRVVAVHRVRRGNDAVAEATCLGHSVRVERGARLHVAEELVEGHRHGQRQVVVDDRSQLSLLDEVEIRGRREVGEQLRAGSLTVDCARRRDRARIERCEHRVDVRVRGQHVRHHLRGAGDDVGTIDLLVGDDRRLAARGRDRRPQAGLTRGARVVDRRGEIADLRVRHGLDDVRAEQLAQERLILVVPRREQMLRVQIAPAHLDNRNARRLRRLQALANRRRIRGGDDDQLIVLVDEGRHRLLHRRVVALGIDEVHLPAQIAHDRCRHLVHLMLDGRRRENVNEADLLRRGAHLAARGGRSRRRRSAARTRAARARARAGAGAGAAAGGRSNDPRQRQSADQPANVHPSPP